MAPRAPEFLEVTIERLLPGGWGLAHAADGRTILVAQAAPQDRVKVRITRTRGQTVFATIAEILTPSPVRVTAPCVYYGRCGGCDFQHLTYSAQLTAKLGIVEDCLRRIAKTAPPDDFTIIPAPQPFAYRTRAEWQYEATTGHIGYFERGSHRVCDVRECLILAAPMQEKLTQVRRQSVDVTSFDRDLELHALAGAERVTDSWSEHAETVIRVGRYAYQATATGFFQSSQDLLPQMLETALRDAQGLTALDLYCGVGLFTVPLAERFQRVIGIENHAGAVALANRNLAAHDLATHAQAICADVGGWLAVNVELLESVDFILLDPPRTGLENGITDHLIKLSAPRLTYVSCDPATLARDLKPLLANNYQLESITALDLFPQTHHIETIARLTAK